MKAARVLGLAVLVALVAAPAAAQGDDSPILTNRGYRLFQIELARRLDEYEVDGRRAPLAECVLAGPRCRELVECTWTLEKADPDPSDPELPLSCVTMVTPDPAIRVRSPETVCNQLEPGGSAVFTGRLAVPLNDTPHWIRLTLRIDLRDLDGQHVEQIAVAQQMWRLEARVEPTTRRAADWLPGLAIAIGALLMLIVLARPKRRPRPAAAPRREAPRARADAAPPEPVVSVRPDMSLEVYPAELLADGRSTARVVVQLTRAGRPMSGIPVTFSGDEPAAAIRFRPSGTTTDLDGIARADYTMPRGSTLGRIAISAEATIEGGRRLSRTRSIRVAQPRLTVRPQQAALPPPGAAPVPLRASLASDSGNPLADIELLAEVVSTGGGSVEPPHRRTDAQGVVVFRFSAGAKAAAVTVRIWPAGCPDGAAEVVFEPA